ncbi:MAG: hypothetical protein Kow00124_07270 [Anaerolineae bacterium]
MTDMRPLRIHDLPRVYRLAGQGVSFDTHLNLTVGDDAWQQVVLTSRGRTQPYVLRQGGESGIGVLHYPTGDLYARLAYIAPSLAHGASEGLWLSMLDGLTVMGGSHGAVNLIAEVDEGAPELDLLRQAGFATYARQEIWVRETTANEGEHDVPLRPAHMADEPAILSLYGLFVPGLLKQVAPLPTAADQTYVLEGKHGLCAAIPVYRGTRAALIEVYLLSKVCGDGAPVLNAVVEKLNGHVRPVYCRMRYQSEKVSHALERAGFKIMTRQMLMIRHTAVRISQPGLARAAGLENGIPLPTPFTELYK